MKLAIHHFTTDFTGKEPCKVWQVREGHLPSSRLLYSLEEAVVACNAILIQQFPEIRDQLATRVFVDGRSTWTVMLCDGHDNWKETPVTVA